MFGLFIGSGCMWSNCGVHDQGWAERRVFGKICYMNYAGCKRKFDVAAFEQCYKRSKRKAEEGGESVAGLVQGRNSHHTGSN